MTDPPEPSLAAQLSVAGRIDAVCDMFERDWNAGRSPRIEDYLANFGETGRQAALVALLEVELELLQSAGLEPDAADYLRRFPEHFDAVRRALGQVRPKASPGWDAELSENTATLQAPDVATSRSGAATRADSTGWLEAPQRIGRFEALQTLGEGAFGTVYRARDPHLDREVAIKLPRDGVLATNEDRARFLREAKIAATLNHPNICPVHEVGEIGDRPYIVLALVEGKTLAELIKSGKPIAPRHAAAAVRRIALALAEAHAKGIVHRDLKPSNIMVNRRGEPVVMDFGLARLDKPGDARLTHSGQIMGSPAYMSPEQARGATEEIGLASDIYSLGVILYELLCGERPFGGTVTEVLGQILHVAPVPPSHRKPGIDPNLEAICLKAMAKEPERRYGSMKELAAALAERLKSGGASAAETSKAPPDRTLGQGSVSQPGLNAVVDVIAAQEQTQARRHRALTLLVGGGLTAVMLLVAGIWFFARNNSVTVVIQIPIDTNDPQLSFFLDGRAITADELAAPIELKPGEHELVVHKNDELFKKFRFHVGKGEDQQIAVKDVTPKASGPQGAVAPFTAEQAQRHQEEWANLLGVPVEFTNSIGMRLRLIPPGAYRRGLSKEDAETLLALDPTIEAASLRGEQPQHAVQLTKPYWIGVHEVTVGQFRQFVSATSFVTRGELVAQGQPSRRTWNSVPWQQSESHPVVNVSWTEAQAFAQWLSRWDGWEYRLPTEAEWEFACRAGTESLWWTGNDLAGLAQIANVADAAAEPRWKPQTKSHFIPASDGHAEAAPVGSYSANPFGLHDMIGNVWEWCSDRFDENHYAALLHGAAVDPSGPTGGDPRVRRGGSWLHGARYGNAASRISSYPDGYGTPYGFRIAMSFDPKQTRNLTRDRVVARMVLQSGGSIRTTDGQEVRGDPRLLRSTPFRIESISLGHSDKPAGNDFRDDDLAALSSLTELKTLQLDKTKVTDAGLKQLYGLKKLRSVSLNDTAVTPEGLKALQDALPDCKIDPEPPHD